MSFSSNRPRGAQPLTSGDSLSSIPKWNPPFCPFFDPHQEPARVRERGRRARCALVGAANAMATRENPGDLPDGQIPDLPVESDLQKIFGFAPDPNQI